MKTTHRSIRALAGSISLLTPLFFLPYAALADSSWTGAVSADWNDPANWTNGLPGGTNAIINTIPANIATISANPTATQNDIFVGLNGGNTGRVDQTGGLVTTNGGNWMFIGQGGGTGTYNLANTAATGGALTGFGTGTGSMTFGRIYAGQSGGNGTINVNTTGTVTMAGELNVGIDAGSVGVVKMDAGTWNRTGDNAWIGRSGGNGTFNMSGGTVTGAGTAVIGVDSGSIGKLTVSGGSYQISNQLQVGRNQATGTVNVANAAGVGGALTGMAQGTGSMTIGNRLYVGGTSDGTNALGTGTMNIHTTGTIAVGNDLALGTGGGTGTVNMDSGTMTTGGWNFIGKDENGSNGTGILKIGGGLLNAGGGRTYIGFNNALGQVIMSGGEYRNTGDWMAVGHNNLANATQSSIVMTGGTVNANLFSIGGDNDNAGKGFVTVSGASALLNANGELWVGNQVNSIGALTVSAGTVQSSNWFAVGRGGSTGVMTISGTGLVQKTNANGLLELGNNGASNATVNLDGGTLSVNRIATGGGVSTFNFNGGVLRATVNEGDYMSGLTTANVKAGGAIINSNTFNITIGQSLTADLVSTGGGLTKTGTGTLTLTSSGNSYTGATTLTNGILALGTLSPGGGNSTLGASTSAAANLVFNGGTLRYTGGNTTFDRNFTINPGKQAIFDVSTPGTVLTLTGGSAASADGLAKTGNGILSLTGTSLHTGTTSVSAGILAASGTYLGGFAVNAGGRLTALHLSEGTLNVPTLTLGAGSAVDFEFGTGNDLINITNAGGLTLGSTGLYLYNTGGTTPFTTNGTYTIFDYNTSFTGTLNTSFTIANSQVGKVYGLTNNTTATTIQLTIDNAVIAAWGVDAAGTWNAAANWTSNPTVPNNLGAIATFGFEITAPRTVTVDGAKTVGVLTFDNANAYNVTGGAGDVISFNNGFGVPLIQQVNGNHTLAAPVALGAATNAEVAAGTTLTISGAISGSSSLTLTATGTLVLSGANSYGQTFVNAGTLTIGGTAGTAGSGAVTLAGGAALSLNRSNASTLATAISGAGSVAQNGTGALTYTGSATYTGPTALNAGTFRNEGTINGTSSLAVNNAATLPAGGSTTVAGLMTVANGGTVALTGGTLASVGAMIGDLGTTGGVTMNSGTWTSTGGTVLAGAPGSVGTVAMTGGTWNQNHTGTLVIGQQGSGTFNMSGSSVLNNQAVVDTSNRGTNKGNVTVGGLQDGGTGGIGVWNLSDTASARVRALTVGDGANTNGRVNINAGASIISQDYDMFLGVSGIGRVDVNGGTAAFNQGWAFIGMNGSGSGTLNVNAGNVSSGRFYVGMAGTGAVNATGGTLAANGGFIVGDGSGGFGNVTVSGLSTVVTIGGESFIGSVGGGTGEFFVNGGAVTTNSNFQVGRSGIGYYTQTAGTFNATGGTPVVGRVAGGAGFFTLNGGTFTQSGAGARMIIGEEGTGIATVTTGLLDAQAIDIGSAATGNGTLNMDGGTVLTGYIGKSNAASIAQLNFNGGLLKARASEADFIRGFDATTSEITSNGANINTNGFDVAISTSTLDGVGAITKTGAGTLGLSTANAHSGGVQLTQGTLAIMNNQALGSGALTVTGGRVSISPGGLFEGRVSYGTNSFDLASPIPQDAIRLSTPRANSTDTAAFGDNSTWGYFGKINVAGNSPVTWTFAEQFDDSVFLSIDGVTVLNDGSWNTVTKGNVTLAPGAHTIEIRLGQGNGGVGPHSGWAFGVGVDMLGRNSTNPADFTPIADATGTLLYHDGTITIANAVSLAVTTEVSVLSTAVLTGAVSGAGGLTKTGNGSLTIAQNSTNAGPTTISAGTLRVGDGGTTGSLSAATITDNAALVFDRSNTISVASTINGTGSVTKNGTGTLNLNGGQNYAILSTTAGTTNVNGSFTAGTATVNANATTNFTSSQTLGALNIGAGAVVTFGSAAPFAGFGGGSSAAVPEPGALGLLVVGALGVLARRRRN